MRIIVYNNPQSSLNSPLRFIFLFRFRLLAWFSADREEKHGLMLEGLSHMQLAVRLQEQVLNTHNLLLHSQVKNMLHKL